MKTSIYSQHEEHTSWLNKLSFYNDEIVVMQKRLEEVNSKNTGMEVRKSVDHFQNQFIIQKNAAEDIRRHIKGEEKALQHEIKSNPVAVDHRKTDDHVDERSMVEHFETNFNALRKEFNAFLADKL